MRRSKGVSTFVATLVLVGIALSLSYVVYEGVSTIAPPEQEVFTNQVNQVGGPQGIVQIVVNASSPGSPLAFEAGGSSSQSGILYFDGAGYGTTHGLCLAGATTFFSILTGSGTITTTGNGESWIDGQWTDSLVVRAGWQEVMFSNASSCTITMPGGRTAVFPGADVSPIPLIGSVPSSAFDLYVPAGSSTGPFLLAFDGSYDRIA
jgi:hypothetical protein